MKDLQQIKVCPTRLAYGEWSHRLQRTIGEGDIHASYSGDRIAMGETLRKPFSHAGSLWIAVGTSNAACEAFRLVAARVFAGESVTYGERTANGNVARADPLGFYHGMRVRHGNEECVLRGPAVLFVPGEIEQPTLF